jgi:ATP-binding cassette, subfamily C (CFTR/MRP), member 1
LIDQYNRRGHGASLSGSSSGASTPHRGNESPPEDDSTLSGSTKHGELELDTLSEKFRKKSFGRAELAETLPVRSTQDGPSKEHSEQGRVKQEVYLEYIKAASKAGFTLFVLAIIMQQVLSLGANVTLSYWGGHNREHGSNANAGKYLLFYGVFSLSATLLGGVAYILIWVLCSIRSSKHLHDRVSGYCIYHPGRIVLIFLADASLRHARALELLRADAYGSHPQLVLS